MLVLGALGSFLEPFCGHLLPKGDNISEKLILTYPHEGPCVATKQGRLQFFTQRGEEVGMEAVGEGEGRCEG